ncbi:MAG: FlgO family outer membrane protein [Magnetococcus sp. YQC-5]
MNKIHFGLASMMIATLMGGCLPPSYQGQSQSMGPAIIQSEVDLIRMSHALSDALVAELRKNHPSFHQRKPLLVTSFVNRNYLDSTSELGNLIADHVASRLTQQGFTVVEPKLRKNLAIRQNQGEFILSRDIEKISHENKAYAVVTGTYTETRETLDFTSRIIALNSRQVLASVDAKVPMGITTRDLLNANAGTAMSVVTQ